MVDTSGTTTYGYDDLYRLTDVTYPNSGVQTYDYDAMGNRTGKTHNLVPTAYSYDDADQVTLAGAVSYTYDDNGNQTGAGSDAFSWDAENRLVSTSIGGVAGSYAYNGDGLRTSRTIGGSGVSYVWDQNASLPVVLQDTSGNRYVYGLDLLARVNGTDEEWYLYDGLGSTTGLADAAGNVTGTYEYDVFGAVRAQSGASTEWSYTGEQNDPTGLEYLRARYYDAETGRFASRDPMPFAQRYSYAEDNPLNVIDPSGLCRLCDFIDDKGADFKDFGSDFVDHPASAPQLAVGTLTALTSSGDRTRVDGVTFYEHCRGSCSLAFAGGASAITLGHDVFARRELGPREVRHEVFHVSQGDSHGLAWIPLYLGEQIRLIPHCRLDFSCYEHNNRFEKEAIHAEQHPKE